MDYFYSKVGVDGTEKRKKLKDQKNYNCGSTLNFWARSLLQFWVEYADKGFYVLRSQF